MDIPDGIALTPFDATFDADPYAVYQTLRRLDPVHKDVTSFYASSWTISDYALVKSLLLDPRLSVDPRTIGMRRDPRQDNVVTLRDPDMMNLDGEDHHRLRALVQKAFTPSSVAKLTAQIRSVATAQLDQISGPEFDVVTEYAKPIPTIVIAQYMGLDSRDHGQFKTWTDTLLMQGYPIPSDAQWEQILAADKALREYVQAAITARREHPQDDLVTRLIQAQDQDERLTDREIVDMCYLLIGAGNFTTTDLISNCIYHALSQDVEGIPDAQVVEEVLRYDGPVLAARRFVLQDITLGDKVITQGSVVNLLLGAANHDPAIFDRADDFDAMRENKQHLTFGRGIHHCLGAPLAKLEATIALELFRQRFPNATVASSRRRKQMDFRGFSSLVVRT